MNDVLVGLRSKVSFLLTVAGMLMAGGLAYGDTYELELNRIQLFGDCPEYEPRQVFFSPRPPDVNERGVGYDTRAGGPEPIGSLILESEDYYFVVSMDFSFGYETEGIIFQDRVDTRDFMDNGAWYEMHSRLNGDRYDISFLRHDPPNLYAERALIFVMVLNEVCVVQLDWRYPIQ